MPVTNGDKVTIRELYTEIRELEGRQTKAADAMEERLANLIMENRNVVLDKWKMNRDDINELQDVVVGLRIADRKWGGLAAIVAAAMTGLGIALKD